MVTSDPPEAGASFLHPLDLLHLSGSELPGRAQGLPMLAGPLYILPRTALDGLQLLIRHPLGEHHQDLAEVRTSSGSSRDSVLPLQAFVAEYAALWDEAGRTGAKIFFADEAHFRADAELRGKWVLKGEPALVDSSSPRHGEKANYYSAVCLETGEVEWMELEGNSNGESSVAFLEQLRERHGGRLNVIWDNAPAHRGPAMRSYLETPGLNLRLVNLPGYSPDFNADEAVWGWVREEATGNQGLGTKALVQKRVNHFLDGLASRKDEVRHRCRTVLQSKAERLPPNRRPDSWHPANGHPTLALV